MILSERHTTEADFADGKVGFAQLPIIHVTKLVKRAEVLAVVPLRHNNRGMQKKNMTAQKWISEIDEITALFKKEFGGLSDKRLNWKPNTQTWSIAQNIDHLIVINESYYPVVRQIRSHTYSLPWIGRFGFIADFTGNTILKAVHPDRRRKTKTFSIWEPHTTDLGADIVDKFVQHQEELKKFIISAMDLVNAGTIISSPANRNVVYRLHKAFDIIVTHERRHFEQAKEALSLRPA